MKIIARYALFAGLCLGLCTAGCHSAKTDDFTGADVKPVDGPNGMVYGQVPNVSPGTGVILKPQNPTDPRFQPDPRIKGAG